MQDIISNLKEKGCLFDENRLIKELNIINSKPNKIEYLKEKLNKICLNYLNNKENNVSSIAVAIGFENHVLKSYNSEKNIELNNSYFDLASITKMFTFKLIDSLVKNKKISYLDKIKDIDNNYNIDYTIDEILKMKGIIETKGKLSESKDKEELLQRLKTATIISRESAKYTDIGFVILSDIFKPYNELLDELVLSKYELKFKYNPQQNVIGNGNDNNLVNDKKTAIMGGLSGAAGLFAKLDDMIKFANLLKDYKFYDQKLIEKIFDYKFFDSKKRQRSYAGLYVKNDNDINYAVKEFSNKTIAHQGYTGSGIVVDLDLKLFNVILVDAFKNNAKVKSEKFFDNYYKLQDDLSYLTLELYYIQCQELSNSVNMLEIK